MTQSSMLEKEKPALDSDANIKLDNEIENRSGNDRRKDCATSLIMIAFLTKTG
jgi:hypothetical protein